MVDESRKTQLSHQDSVGFFLLNYSEYDNCGPPAAIEESLRICRPLSRRVLLGFGIKDLAYPKGWQGNPVNWTQKSHCLSDYNPWADVHQSCRSRIELNAFFQEEREYGFLFIGSTSLQGTIFLMHKFSMVPVL